MEMPRHGGRWQLCKLIAPTIHDSVVIQTLL